jgi:hypothetical protein
VSAVELLLSLVRVGENAGERGARVQMGGGRQWFDVAHNYDPVKNNTIIIFDKTRQNEALSLFARNHGRTGPRSSWRSVPDGV